MQIIPLSPVPNQRLSFRMAETRYDAEVFLRRGNLYISLWKDGANLMNNRVMRSYSPMEDGFMMVDSEGLQDPTYKQLGSRFLLMKTDG